MDSLRRREIQGPRSLSKRDMPVTANVRGIDRGRDGHPLVQRSEDDTFKYCDK